jgi:hypothetical protein
MKKVLTITCHQVYNYGATLQQYALLEVLKELGYEAKTINYNPPYLSNHFKLWAVPHTYQKNLFLKLAYISLKLPRRILSLKRKKSFDIFENKYLSILPKNYSSNEELKDDLPLADIYICGSDQIWNSFFHNGKDPAFYLNFVPDSKLKISYAASFAIERVEEDLKPFVESMARRINHISVRETSALNILNDLGISNAIQVLDPVFLISRDFWISTFTNKIPEKYILIYDFDSNKQIEKIANKEAAKFGFKIYTVNKNIKYAHKNFNNEGPDKFLSLLNNAEFILTNSFHAVCFSLIFNKKFVVVNRTEKINTRMKDLTELAGVPELLLKPDEYRGIDDVNIDYCKVNIMLNNQIENSRTFLINALQENDTFTTN